MLLSLAPPTPMTKRNRQNITAFVYDKRGRLLSVGRNSYIKTHPMQARMAREAGEDEKIYLHAEIDALVKVRDWGLAHKLVITRFTKDGNPASARPCKVCERMIKLVNIKEVQHT
jgi:YD repeat-containing protein